MVEVGYIFTPGYRSASILEELHRVSLEPESDAKRHALEQIQEYLDKERKRSERLWTRFGSANEELTDFLNNTSFSSTEDMAQKLTAYFKKRNPTTTVTPGKLEKMMEIHSCHDREFLQTSKIEPRDDFLYRVLVVEASKDYPTK